MFARPPACDLLNTAGEPEPEVLGSWLGWLFRRGNEFHISMRVGPWNTPAAWDAATLGVTALIVVGFCAFILLVSFRKVTPP